jgi:hypothetical protein
MPTAALLSRLSIAKTSGYHAGSLEEWGGALLETGSGTLAAKPAV